MSTRCTIAHSDEFHLYEECFDRDNIYLRLDEGDWAASLETATIDWRDGESTRPTLHVRMSVDLWRKVIEGWTSSYWANHPEDDHRKVDFDPEALSWLEKINRKVSDEQ